MIRNRVATIVAASAVLCIASAAHAGRIDQGTVEAGASLLLDFEGANGATVSGDLLGGYFVLDGVLAGGRLGFYNDELLTMISAFGTVEQHFETDTPWLPYVGASLGVLHASIGEASDSTTALAVGAAAGIKFYITETAALDFSLNGVFASDEVFVADDEAESFDLTLKAGLRFFLF